jgi:hypothetical protein
MEAKEAETQPEGRAVDSVQAAIECVVRDLLVLPEVSEGKKIIREEYFLPRARDTSEAGLAYIDHAIEEMAVHAMGAVAADPANPRLCWYEFMPHVTYGEPMAGGRYGFDNPDRVFRHFFVNRDYRYEVRGRFASDGSVPFYLLFESCEDKPPGWGYPLAFLHMEDIEPDADGDFVITVDSEPTAGRKNHLYLPPDAAHVLIRDTLVDWNQQMPTPLSVRRVSGPQIAPKSFEEMRRQARDAVIANAANAFLWYDYALADVADNTFATPEIRPAPEGTTPWGMTATGRYNLTEDDALIVTLRRETARYLGIMVAEPWMLSIDYTQHTSTLNHREVWPNPDDSITYVIARKDPGVQNWLDTDGVQAGVILVRWELLEQTPDPEHTVREVRLVKLEDVAAAVPAQMPRFSPEMRREQRAHRAKGYAKRLNAVLSAAA